jgi:hypothetical protein
MPINIKKAPVIDSDVVTQVLIELASLRTVQQLVAAISYTDSTGVVFTVPENCLILDAVVVRTTAWDAPPSFELGKAGDADWIINNHQHELVEDAPGVARIAGDPVRTTLETGIVATWDQGAATQGAGYLVVTYLELA